MLVLQPGLLSVPWAPSGQHRPVSGGFSDSRPSGDECRSPDRLGKSPARSRDSITATRGRVLQEPGEVQNRPQHHLGGTASPRFREASQAAQGHLSCCRLRTRSLLSHTPAPRLCSASAPHHRAAPVPRSLRKTHPEKRSHTPAALRAVSWGLEVHLSAASPKRPGIWRQRMPRSPPEKEAALGRCPWDGAAGEAHTGTAGSRLDAEHGLVTPASCTRATPNPEPTAGLRGARVTRSSPAPCTDSRQGLSHVQPPAGGISAAPAAPGPGQPCTGALYRGHEAEATGQHDDVLSGHFSAGCTPNTHSVPSERDFDRLLLCLLFSWKPCFTSQLATGFQ